MGPVSIYTKFRNTLKILEPNSCNMLEEMVKDFSAYFNLDVLSGVQTVQDVVDNMLTRLEELTSVLQMIKLKNLDCASAVSEDITKYRSEITVLSKKIAILTNVISKLQNNVDLLEKHVEKAEIDFGVSNENRIKSLLKPFLKRKDNNPATIITQNEKLHFETVMYNFAESSNT